MEQRIKDAATNLAIAIKQGGHFGAELATLALYLVMSGRKSDRVTKDVVLKALANLIVQASLCGNWSVLATKAVRNLDTKYYSLFNPLDLEYDPSMRGKIRNEIQSAVEAVRKLEADDQRRLQEAQILEGLSQMSYSQQ